MKIRNLPFSLLTAIMIILSMLVTISCNKDDDSADQTLSIGLIVDYAGIDDKTFNQSTYEGILNAQDEIDFDFDYRVGLDESEYGPMIDEFVAEGRQLIIAPGFHLLDAMTEAALKYPDVNFLLLDVAPENIPANMACVIFKSNEASFLCGFLSSYWAYHQDPVQPVAGWISGPPIDPIQAITNGYTNGIAYFTSSYNIPVETEGYALTSFTDSIAASELTENLIGEGADVIFVFAGDGGNAALSKVKTLNKWAIGMDSDQYVSFPAMQEILLTSCLKNLGNIAREQIISFSQGAFPAGTIIYGDLENDGVGIAPYHNYETSIPDSIKSKIETLKSGIISGLISTGE